MQLFPAAIAIALVATSAFGQTTRTAPSAATSSSTVPSASATSPASPCYSSLNPTSPCYSGTSSPSYSATTTYPAPTPYATITPYPPNPPGAPASAPTNSAAGAALTADQARARIEAHGYSNISRLAKGVDGAWRGRAVKDGKPVNVLLDAQNTVAEY